jgi:hypothetical protein
LHVAAARASGEELDVDEHFDQNTEARIGIYDIYIYGPQHPQLTPPSQSEDDEDFFDI